MILPCPPGDPLELLRARSGLSIDAEGRFLHRGEPITHARTLEVLWRSLERAPDGRYLVRIGRESAYVAVEETPYVVRGVIEVAAGSARRSSSPTARASRSIPRRSRSARTACSAAP